MNDPTLLDHGLVVVIAAFLLYGIFVGRKKLGGVELDTRSKLAIYWSNGILLWFGAAAVCGVWLLGGRSFETLGFTEHHESPGLTAVITAAFIVWAVAESWHDTATPHRRARLLARLQRDAPFIPATTREAAHFSFLGITAGITEEIIFRGFLISYVLAFTGTSTTGQAVAVILPAMVFAIAHAYQGRKAVARILVLAIAFGTIFVVSGSLLIPIVLHAVIDVAGGIIAVRIAMASAALDGQAAS